MSLLLISFLHSSNACCITFASSFLLARKALISPEDAEWGAVSAQRSALSAQFGREIGQEPR